MNVLSHVRAELVFLLNWESDCYCSLIDLLTLFTWNNCPFFVGSWILFTQLLTCVCSYWCNNDKASNENMMQMILMRSSIQSMIFMLSSCDLMVLMGSSCNMIVGVHHILDLILDHSVLGLDDANCLRTLLFESIFKLERWSCLCRSQKIFLFKIENHSERNKLQWFFPN